MFAFAELKLSDTEPILVLRHLRVDQKIPPPDLFALFGALCTPQWKSFSSTEAIVRLVAGSERKRWWVQSVCLGTTASSEQLTVSS